jgi:hypothetical protein
MRVLLRLLAFAFLILAARIELRAQSPANSDPPPAAPSPNSAPAAPQQAKEIWTNENIGALHGRGSASQSEASFRGRHDFRSSSSDGVSIIRPSAGTVVAPGETMQIEISADSDKDISNMSILSPLGIGNESRSSPPWFFTLNVPKNDTDVSGSLIGPKPIFAGFRRCGRGPDLNGPCYQGEFPAASTVVDVEDPTPATKLWSLLPAISFDGTTDVPLNVTIGAMFAGGLQLDVTRSTRISFSSTNRSVAAVDENGAVTQIGPGNTEIEVTYVGGGATTKLSIPVASWYLPKSIQSERDQRSDSPR